jgi:hypothetical protein
MYQSLFADFPAACKTPDLCAKMQRDEFCKADGIMLSALAGVEDLTPDLYA